MQVQDTVDTAGIKARCRRGMQLAREGKVARHGDLFVVRGRMGNYTVSLNHQTYGETCECKDWRKHGFGHSCKHIYAVTIAAAKQQ